MASGVVMSHPQPVVLRSINEHVPIPQVCLPDPQDAVFPLAETIVNSYNKRTHDRLRDPLRVKAISQDPTSDTDHTEAPRSYLLVRHLVCIKLQLKSPRHRRHRRPQVLLNVDGHWSSLQAWLDDTLPEPRRTSIAEQAARQIWAESGKQFPFLELPNEIQDMILGFAVGPQLLSSICLRQTPFRRGHPVTLVPRLSGWRRQSDPTTPAFSSPNTKLFLVNREIGRRAREIFLEDSPKVFRRGSDVQFIHCLPGLMRSSLRRIHLALGNHELIEYFRIPLPGTSYKPGWQSHGDTFQYTHFLGLPSLRSVTLFFESTISCRSDPWNVARWADPGKTPKEKKQVQTCQARLHEYMLPFIAVKLLHLRKLCRTYINPMRIRYQVTGYIKTHLRESWNHILNDESQENLDYVQGLKQDIIREVVSLQDRDWHPNAPWKRHFPPKCKCPQRCWSNSVPDHIHDKATELALIDAYTYDFDDICKPTVAEKGVSHLAIDDLEVGDLRLLDTVV